MRLMVVAGFFGSGKTTLIVNVAKRLAREYRLKLAIVVNDIGEIGVDDKVMDSYGLKVKKLFGGCVCCQLGDDMIRTFRTVQTKLRPDLVILEPSGAADPSQILSVVTMARGFEIEMLPLVVLVDATQFKVLSSEMPLAIRKVAFGEVVLINKVDAVSGAELSEVVSEVEKINKSAIKRSISSKSETDVQLVTELLFGDRPLKGQTIKN